MIGLFAKRCSCGAVTVSDWNSNYSVSMEEPDFEKHFPQLELEDGEYGNCNYCVNHWGIDLCGCGSGEKVGECDEDFEQCRNNKPSQVLGELKEYALWN